MDLLLVIDQSGSMGDCISSGTFYYDIDLDNIENEGFEYDEDYGGWLYFDEETGYVLYYDDWYGLALITDFGEDEEDWLDYEGYVEVLEGCSAGASLSEAVPAGKTRAGAFGRGL